MSNFRQHGQMKSRDGKSQRREEKKKKEYQRRDSQKKEDPGARKVGKPRNTAFFQWFVAPEGRKVGSLKRRVRSNLARWEMTNCMPLRCEAHLQVKTLKTPHVRSTFGSWLKKCTRLWSEAHFQVKMHKTHHSQTTFGSWDVEKVHAVVARSKFPSQNVQNSPCLDHFWKLTCRKSVRRCGAKHISNSKVLRTDSLAALLEVDMSKKCTPLWREAHVEVKMLKAPHVQTTFGRSDVVSRFNYNHTRHSTPRHYNYNYATLHYTTLITSHFTTLHHTPLHYTALHFTTLNHTTLHHTTPHYTTPHHTTLTTTTATTTTTLLYPTLHYTTFIAPPQIQLQLHYTNYITPQLQLHYAKITTTAALHHTTSSSCGWGYRPGDHCNHWNHSKKHNSTTFQSISGFALPSVVHNNQTLL